MPNQTEYYILPYSTSGVGKSLHGGKQKITVTPKEISAEQLKVLKQIFGRVKRKKNK